MQSQPTMQQDPAHALSRSFRSVNKGSRQALGLQHIAAEPGWTGRAVRPQIAEGAAGSRPSLSSSRSAPCQRARTELAMLKPAGGTPQAQPLLPCPSDPQALGLTVPSRPSQGAQMPANTGSSPLRPEHGHPCMKGHTALDELLLIHQHISPASAQLHESLLEPADQQCQPYLHHPESCATASDTSVTGIDGLTVDARASCPAMHRPYASGNLSHPAGPSQHVSRRINEPASLLTPETDLLQPDRRQHVHSSQLLAHDMGLGPPSDFSSNLCSIMGSDTAQDQLPGSLQSAALNRSHTQASPGLLHDRASQPLHPCSQQVIGSSATGRDTSEGPGPGLPGANTQQTRAHDTAPAFSNTPSTPRSSLMPPSQASAAVLGTPQSCQAAPRPAAALPPRPSGLSQIISGQQASSGRAETDSWPSQLGPSRLFANGPPEEQAGKAFSKGRPSRGQSRQETSGSYPGAHLEPLQTGPGTIMRPINLNVNECSSARISHMQVSTCTQTD